MFNCERCWGFFKTTFPIRQKKKLEKVGECFAMAGTLTSYWYNSELWLVAEYC